MSPLDATRADQEAAVNFTRSLLLDWMRQNTLEGISLQQSLWVFSRFETFEISAPWGSSRVDIFKMFNSGAIPTLYYCLCKVQPDSMLEQYHWLTQARIDWVKDRIASHIGAGMASYLSSLP